MKRKENSTFKWSSHEDQLPQRQLSFQKCSKQALNKFPVRRDSSVKQICGEIGHEEFSDLSKNPMRRSMETLKKETRTSSTIPPNLTQKNTTQFVQEFQTGGAQELPISSKGSNSIGRLNISHHFQAKEKQSNLSKNDQKEQKTQGVYCLKVRVSSENESKEEGRHSWGKKKRKVTKTAEAPAGMKKIPKTH